MPSISRREALAIGTLAAGSLALPRRAPASVPAGDRRFLFIFCDGGWDQGMVFAPAFDSPDIPIEAGAEPGQVGDIPFVNHPERPAVERFLEENIDRTTFFNGFEVRSIAHPRCRQVLLTGVADGGRDDWPSILAGHASADLLLPCLVASGPTFSHLYADRVVRLGETGQLSGLLDGSALLTADRPFDPPAAAVQALVDAQVSHRAQAFARSPLDPQAARVATRYQDALGELDALSALSNEIDLSVDPSRSFIDQAKPVLDGLELGLARCGVIRYLGVNEIGWDSHYGSDPIQSAHFLQLFGDLILLMAELDARGGPATGGRLSDETTVVVISEMGRSPWKNVQDGKDHWTWTSAMLIGGGIRGNRAIGAYDTQGIGQPVDLSSGEPHSGGERMTAAHLGASLLALGDVDPEAWLPGVQPISLG